MNNTFAIASELPRLRVSARVVWDAADPFQKISYGERLARNLHTPLRRIEGGKHFTPDDHPDVVAEEINNLLHEVARTSSKDKGCW